MTSFQNFTRRAAPIFRLWLVKRWQIVWRALVKFDETDGEQRAASFAYYAFFAMFPLILLFITLGTTFLGDKETASSTIIAYVSRYMPLESQDAKVVITTIDGVVKSRKSAGLIAFAVLVWSALRFFQALVHGVNRAWGTKEYSWWRLPIKNLLMTAILASALLLGILTPAVLKQARIIYWNLVQADNAELNFTFVWQLFDLANFIIPLLVLFYGMSMFYKFAPRRRTSFREVWTAALFTTVSLEILQRLFTLYTKNIGQFNALYGTFGSVVALLLWIYLSGSIIILGGCLAAAKYEIEMSLTDQAESNRAFD